MTTFGDHEPEDSWAPNDDLLVLLLNLARRCDLLGEQIERDLYTPSEWLDEITERANRVRLRDGLTPAEKVRVALLLDDIAFLKGRIDDG